MNDPLQRRALLGFIAIAAGALACRRAFGGDALDRADPSCVALDAPDDAPSASTPSSPTLARPATRAHPLSAEAAARRRLLAACRAAAR